MAGGKFRTGTGSRTKPGTMPKPLADRGGNKRNKVRNMTPREVTAKGK